MRHGESTANAAGVLAGRDHGVDLTDRGVEQVREARALVPEIADADAAVTVLSSPIHRCVRTTEELLAVPELAAPDHAAPRSYGVLDELAEVEYGDWTGRPIKELLREPLWKTVRTTPSRARFPGGESLAEVAARSRSALESACRAAEETSSTALVLVSHGDVIKLMLAHALGLEVDRFQRIAVSPASVSRIAVGKPQSHPPMTVTMPGATARGRRAQTQAPGGGR